MQMPVISISLIRFVSGGGSATADVDRNPQTAPTPAPAAALRNCLRLQPSCSTSSMATPFHCKQALVTRSLTFQLFLELVEQPPIHALRDDFLRVRLDHSSLVQPQGIETHGVLGVVLAPFVERQLFHHL